MCDHIFDATATVRQAKVNSDIDEAFCPPIPLVAMRAGEIYSDSSLVGRLVLGFISAWSFAADFCPYCPHDIAKLLGVYDSDVEDAIAFWSDKGLVDRVCGPLFNKERLNVNLLAWNDLYGALTGVRNGRSSGCAKISLGIFTPMEKALVLWTGAFSMPKYQLGS